MTDPESRLSADCNFTITPVSAVQHGPPPNIKYIGVLRADPRLNHFSIPLEYERHPLIANRFFYTIPEQLLDAVCRPQGESIQCDQQLLEMDLVLSRMSGDHTSQIGFWDVFPIQCGFLDESLPLRNEDLAVFQTLTEKQRADIGRSLRQRLASFAEVACAYAGWLMTDPTYLSELENLIVEYRCAMRRWGTHLVGLPIPSSQPPGIFNSTGEAG